MTKSNSPLRREDHALLTGRGRFVDDLTKDGLVYGCVVRSAYPHADILGVDVEAAKALRGVSLVLTYADLVEQKIGDLPCVADLSNQDGSLIHKPPRPILAGDRVRHVGEPVAFVVADSLESAQDAADLVDIDYRERPGVSSTRKALRSDVRIWDDAPDNICFDWSTGSDDEVAEAMTGAEHVVEVEVHHPRMSITPIEPRSALAEYHPETDRLTLHVQTQGVHMVRRVLAQDVLNIPLENLTVITPDVGGSFGMKIFTYPEYALVLVASRQLRRPVKWTATRSESFVSDSHGRARTDRARLGIDADGRFTALQIEAVSDLGACLSYVGPAVPTQYAYTVIGHTYRIPCIHYRCRGVFTNATPTDAYRGAGKPEMVATVEQLIDKAAHDTGIDRVELRRRNLVRPDELPYPMPNGQVIDSGDFPGLLDRALQLADWNGFPKRRREAERHGLLRGIGLGMYMHSTGGSKAERAEVRLCRDGSVLAVTGTQSGGQGHATTLASLVAEVLEIDASRVEVIQGDTDAIATGGGTGGSSMTAIAGVTMRRAAEHMLTQARQAASNRLEASAADLEYRDGAFVIAGTDRKISLREIAAAREQGGSGCVGAADFEGVNTTHPSGAYVVELECDPATGVLEIVQLVGVDDIGRILFPAIVDGQLHGSWAQSVGTSLMEAMRFDEDEEGHVLTGSLMDYQLPRAQDLPFFTLEKRSTPSKTNDLGVKGVGESGSLGAPGAIENAISDLLGAERFEQLHGPATPLKVWNAIRRIRPGQH